MEHFYQNISGWFDYENIYSNMVAKAPNTAHFVEMGSWKGKSSAFMATEIIRSQKQIKFDCVDTWQGSPEHQAGGAFADENVISGTLFQEFLKNMLPVHMNYQAVQLSSVQAAALYEDASLDFVFLDGDHSYAAVHKDICAWRPKVKQGGFLGGHDYGPPGLFPGVAQAVHELCDNFVPVAPHSWIMQIT
jgi:hypothetical protein